MIFRLTFTGTSHRLLTVCGCSEHSAELGWDFFSSRPPSCVSCYHLPYAHTATQQNRLLRASRRQRPAGIWGEQCDMAALLADHGKVCRSRLQLHLGIATSNEFCKTFQYCRSECDCELDEYRCCYITFYLRLLLCVMHNCGWGVYHCSQWFTADTWAVWGDLLGIHDVLLVNCILLFRCGEKGKTIRYWAVLGLLKRYQ